MIITPRVLNTSTLKNVKENRVSSGFSFTLGGTPVADSLRVYSQGLARSITREFTLSGSVVTFIQPVPSNTNMSFIYQTSSNQTPLREFYLEKKLSGSQQTLILDYTPFGNLEEVYSQGRLLHPSTDYSINGNIVTLIEGSLLNTFIKIKYYVNWS